MHTRGQIEGPLVNQLPVSGFFGLWCLVVGLFFMSNALLCGFCRGPLLEHRAPPVIAGRRGCSSSPTLLSPALPLVGIATFRNISPQPGRVTRREERNRPNESLMFTICFVLCFVWEREPPITNHQSRYVCSLVRTSRLRRKPRYVSRYVCSLVRT